MLKLEILHILQNPDVTMEQQADMLADMMRERIDRAYEDGLDVGYRRGFNDGESMTPGIDDDTGFVK